jgi:hypothetical protein
MKNYHLILILLVAGLLSCQQKHPSDVTRLGNFKNRPVGYQAVFMPGGQAALFIKNEKLANGKIVNVMYFIGEKGNPERKFRVRLYTIDTLNHLPANDLITDTLIASATKGNTWLTVDVKRYHITFPANGIFVAMQWLTDEDLKLTATYSYQYLTYNNNRSENNSWYCALGINWYQLSNSKYNVMISLDVLKNQRAL